MAKAADPKQTAVGCLTLLVLVVVGGFLLSTCSGGDRGGGAAAVTDDPVLASEVEAAVAKSAVAGDVHDVDAESDGTVYVYLNERKEDLGGVVHAQDLGKYVAVTILTKVESAKKVVVFDADRSMVDIYSPPE
jgi:hypothetical protein